jgi:hypothetical protein
MARGATEELEETGMNGEGKEDEQRMLRLLLGSRLLRRGRLRRALIADLLGERAAGEQDEDEDEGGRGEVGQGEEKRLVRLLIGGGLLRRRRIRRALLAHFLGERGEAMGEGEADEGDEEEEGARGDERRLLRLLIASRFLRRPRVRRALVAHLLRDRGEAEAGAGEDAGEVGDSEIGQGDERRIVKLLIGSRILRRARVRRAILAHLIGEHAEARGEEDVDEDEDRDEGGDTTRRLMRFLVARRGVRRGRGREAVLAGLLRNEDDED